MYVSLYIYILYTRVYIYICMMCMYNMCIMYIYIYRLVMYISWVVDMVTHDHNMRRYGDKNDKTN